VQLAPHEIPAGFDVTVPLPVPAFATVSVNCCSVNVAATDTAASIVTMHVPVPVQPPPLHPLNTESDAGAAVNVTIVCALYVAVQLAPHEIPAGLDVTVPLPVPAFATVSMNCCSVNVAVTDTAASIVTTQLPVPVQPPPLHPLNTESDAGAAVNVTTVCAL
jgi:hypothetical protein